MWSDIAKGYRNCKYKHLTLVSIRTLLLHQNYEADLTDEEKWQFAVEQQNNLQRIWVEEAKNRGVIVPLVTREATQSMHIYSGRSKN